MARCEEASELFGKHVGKQLVIFDIQGVSMWPNSDGISLFKEVMRSDSE